MEKYVTAEIEVVNIEEDVITASVTSCEARYPQFANTSMATGWTVHYSDGSTANFSGPDKPAMCP